VYLFGHQFITSSGGYDAIKIAGQMCISGKPELSKIFI
jgi:hypothetical protein